jgi:hypothetical protein
LPAASGRFSISAVKRTPNRSSEARSSRRASALNFALSPGQSGITGSSVQS